jgi:hypothetical protein
MASTYSQYKIELVGTGEQAGTWGTTTNNNFGSATPGTYQGFEQAIGGRADVTMSGTTTLSLTNSNAAQDARALYLNLSGTLSGAADLVVPALQKSYLVKNGTTGGFAVTIKVTGQTGVSIPNGKTVWVYNNGTDIVTAVDFIPEIATTTVDATNIEVTNIKAKDGTSAGSIADSTGVVTLASSVLTTTDINGGTIDGAVIGGASADAGSFTTLNTSGQVVFNDAGADVDFRVEGDTEPNLLFVDASADNIGMGTNSITTFGTAYRTLQLQASSGTGDGSAIRFMYDGGTANTNDLVVYNNSSGGNIRQNGALTLNFLVNGSERMRIDSSGNVGIGTSSPANRVSIVTASGSDGIVSVKSPTTDTAGILIDGGSASNKGAVLTFAKDATTKWRIGIDSAIGGGTNNNLNILGSSTDALLFGTNATERVRIVSDGNVGIGTDSPNYTSVGSSSRVLAVSAPTAGDGVAFLNLNGTRTGGGVDSCAAVNFFNNGTANPLAAIFGVRNATDTAGILTFRTNDTEHMRLTSIGDLYIGRTSDGDGAGLTLDVSGLIRCNRDGATPMVVNRNTDDGTLISLRQAGTEEGTI